MKQIISATSAVLMMSVLCLSACASEPTQTEFPTPEKYVITTSTECTAEEYISAVALEKKITLDEARDIHQNECLSNAAKALPFSDKYYKISKEKYIDQGYYLTCVATAHVLVDNQNFGHVCEILGVAAPYVDMSGRCTNVQWSGAQEAQFTTEDIRIFANGSIFFDVSNDISIGGGAFLQVGSSSSTTTRYRYFAQEQFHWGLTDI